MTRIFGLAIAGAAGTVCRYLIVQLFQKLHVTEFPWGTLVVNLLGCFLFGVFVALADHKMIINQETKTLVLIGFAGAFTTFSTFAYDTHELFKANNYLPAIGNISLHLFVGVISLILGIKLVNSIG